MDERKTFDLLANPLEGINLIEASAGTGKTYTIAGLFLRLILEKEPFGKRNTGGYFYGSGNLRS